MSDMTDKADFDPDLEEVFAEQVTRGEFASVEQARQDFWDSIGEGIAEFEAGGGVDIEVVRAELHERYANWPRAAE